MLRKAFIYGINTVAETLEHHPARISQVYYLEESKNPRIKNIINEARHKELSISSASKDYLEKISTTEKNQGIVAEIIQRNYFNSKTAIDYLQAAEKPLVLVLDDLDDPRNIGACIRTANAAGVDMVVVSKNRINIDNPVISKISSGASELTNIAVISNLSQFIDKLKNIGFWVCGSSGTSKVDYKTINYRDSIAMIMGSEAKGMRQLTTKKCDYIVSIPINGQVDSLNVSVSCGVLLYEAIRQRESI